MDSQADVPAGHNREAMKIVSIVSADEEKTFCVTVSVTEGGSFDMNGYLFPDGVLTTDTGKLYDVASIETVEPLSVYKVTVG